MPASVHIPVRIRVDSESLDTRCGCLEEALAKAAGRALANSRDVVVASRGGYVGVRIWAPEFHWTGEGAAGVSADRRDELERRWTATLVEACKGAELTVFAEEAARAPDPLPPDPARPFDPDLWDEDSATYEVASYDDAGSPTPVKSRGRTLPKPRPGSGKWGYYWAPIHNHEELVNAFWSALALRNRDSVDAEYFGAIYVNSSDGEFWLAVYHRSLSNSIFDGPLELSTFKYENHNWNDEVPGLSPEGTYVLEYVGDGTNEHTRYAVYHKYFDEEIRASLEQENEAVTEAAIETEVRRRANKYTAPKLFHLDTGGWGAVLALSADLPSRTFEVIPLSTWGEIPVRAEKGATKGGTGAAETEKAGAVEGAEAQESGTVFPTYEHDGEVLECEGFEGEPSLDELGEDGDRLRPHMERVAQHLDIDTCDYAGAFCLNAMKFIATRADDVATYSVQHEEGEIKLPSSGKGNLGPVDFKPVPSATIQLLQHLAAAAPLIDGLEALIETVYSEHGNSEKMTGYRHRDAAGWILDFTLAILSASGRSMGYLFAMTCRVLLLQLLRASWRGIRDREMAGDGYADRFVQLVQAQVTELNRLKSMLDRLKPLAPKSVGDEAGTLLKGGWQAARHAVISLIETQEPPASPAPGTPTPSEPTLERKDGQFGMRDSKGYWWSRDDLEMAISLREAVIEGIDPLVIQIDADPELQRRFVGSAENIKKELRAMLLEMEIHNASKTGEVERDAYFAFQASKIYEAQTRFSGTARTGYNFTGIHKLAHEALVEAAQADDLYRYGVKELFDSEMGKKELIGFFEFTGVLLLCVICAPLGTAVGGALAVYHEHEALEEQRLFKSLLNPELVITRAEVEIDLFVAELGVALAFIPEIGTILKGGAKAGSALLKGELMAFAKTALTQAVKGIAKEILKNLEKGLFEAFIKEFVKAEIINELVGKLIVGPVVDQIQADFERKLEAGELAQEL